MNLLNLKKLGAFALVASLSSSVVYADEAQALKDLAEAQKLYNARKSDDLSSVKNAAEMAAKALREAETAETKYDALILKSRAVYFQGNSMTEQDAKLALYQDGMNATAEAKKLMPAAADAFFFYAVNLGAWANTKGVMASLGRAPELKQNLADAMARKTKAGAPGETIDGYGPHRVKGRMLLKLPGFAGGNKLESAKELRIALAGDPSYVINTNFLVETLRELGEAEQAEAIRLLKGVVNKTVDDFNPLRKPESAKELDRSRELLKDMTG